MYCQKCGTEITNESQRFCHNCGVALGSSTDYTNRQSQNGLNRENKEKGITAKINKLAGGEGQVHLHLRDMVSGVFRQHNAEDAEQLFICGTSTTTPKESDIITEWPKPWLYSRVLVLLLAVYFALTLLWNRFGNPYALMNIPYIGTLICPIAILVFFFEMNVPRNISIIKTFKVFMVGGISSLFLTLILFEIAPPHDLSTISGAVIVGIVEELGKLMICAFFISRHKGKLYLLNGILYGGAIGAGFAVFESVGYALYYGIGSGVSQALQAGDVNNLFYYFYDQMLAIVKVRGFLSPGGHIAWAAIEGFAIILAMQGMEFKWEVLVRSEFLKIVWIPIVLHALWDTGLPTQNQLLSDCKYGFLIGVVWIILLVFISRGLQQISEVREKVQGE